MHLVYLNLIPSLDRDAEGIKVISEVSCGSEGILHNIIPGSGSGEEAPPLYLIVSLMLFIRGRSGEFTDYWESITKA